MKLSALQAITDGSDDSLLMLSYSTDGGTSYETRAIKFEDFADDIDLGDLKNVSADNRDLLEAMAQELVARGIVRDKELDEWVAQGSTP